MSMGAVINNKGGVLRNLFKKEEPINFSMERRIKENRENGISGSIYSVRDHDPNEWEKEAVLTMVKGMSYKEKTVCLSYLLDVLPEEDVNKILEEKKNP